MYQQRISEIYEHLSPGYRRIADFLLNNYREAAFMTAVGLSKATQTDTASVVRFAQRLGYPGYPELVAEVQEEVRRDLRSVYEPGPEEQTPAAVFRRSLIEDRQSLDYMLHHPDLLDVEPVIEALESAQHIFVVAEGTAIYLAEQFAVRLQAFRFNALALPSDTVSRIALLASLRAGDVCLGIGMAGNNPGVTAALKIAREEGVRTIAVVSSAASGMAQAAEFVLLAPARSTGVIYSLTATAAVLQALAQVMTLRLEDRAAEWALRVERLAQRYAAAWQEPVLPIRDIIQEYNSSRDQEA